MSDEVGIYQLDLVENQTNTRTFQIDGITTATSYSAAVDIRIESRGDATALLQLTSPSGGLVLSSNGSYLQVAMTITEAQIDPIADDIAATGAYWSLKVTAPDSTTRQYLIGPVTILRTPTA